MNKYGNRKVTTSDGQVFDSQKEANRWIELKLMERAGEITKLQRQVKYVLIPAQYEENQGKGKRFKLVERECAYVADFVYQDKLGNLNVEDTKGFKTKNYVIKRKLMLHVYGIRIKEV